MIIYRILIQDLFFLQVKKKYLINNNDIKYYILYIFYSNYYCFNN